MIFFYFQGPPRISNLEAPIMLLTGHEGDIFTAKFSPDGQLIASSGFDRLICKYSTTVGQSHSWEVKGRSRSQSQEVDLWQNAFRVWHAGRTVSNIVWVWLDFNTFCAWLSLLVWHLFKQCVHNAFHKCIVLFKIILLTHWHNVVIFTCTVKTCVHCAPI